MSLEMTHLSKEALERHRKAVEAREIAKKIQSGGGPRTGGGPPGAVGQSAGGPPPERFGPQSGGAPPGPKKDL